MTQPKAWDLGDHSSKLPQATLKDSTEKLIRSLLLNGDMKPGEIYSANNLAQQLSISNSPVREAMIALSHAGLLQTIKNRGFQVVELTPKDRLEVYEMRLMVEVEAVHKAASLRLSDNEAAHLLQLAQESLEIAQNSSGNSIGDYLDADDKFHTFLVSLIGNRRCSKMVQILRDQSRVNNNYSHLTDSEELVQTAREHILITNAVLENEPKRAKNLMIDHLEYAKP
ncbi:GntR family transcriptional regulator [Corynebacterium epidermidicanis]|uniref:Transcriptional regulator n=1 Tax=Corynebacterium epidermidicanis TaxID=1050174 RepID=A0A0G3GT51_9CORY|nr:GntR family transcriptional regulator [Corynebacterium epidermidicanis]AKK03715.1 transcriptional regulator [Corynebacterium epidermidicanis]